MITTLLLISALVHSAEVDTASRFWSPVAGWLEYSHTDGGLKVFDSHLEGFACNTNIGLIRFGTHSEGGTHTYGNTGSDNYGVNNDSTGNLSGTAWSPTVGWIHFAPEHGGVVIDPETGIFNGFAVNENIGWISFSGEADDKTTYGVTTDWRGSGVAITEEGLIKASGEMAPGIAVLNNPVNSNSGSVELAVSVLGPSRINVVILSPVGALLDEQKFETYIDGRTLHRFSWNLKNKSGIPAGPGSYLAVARVRCSRSGISKQYKTLIGLRHGGL
jgi:hypothetical protein